MENTYGARRAAQHFGLAWLAGIALAVAAVVMSVTQDLPIREPDGVLPSYVTFPGVLLLTILIDVVPRVVHRASRSRAWSRPGLRGVFREVMAERWPASHWWFALTGLAAWYLSYAAFRNVKSMAPFVNEHLFDDDLESFDKFLFAGHEPAAVLHAWLGEGVAAHLLSGVYILWIGLVPVSIAIALVWTRHTNAGAWYVTAVALDWCFGAAIYVMVPTLGPIYSDPGTFAGLPHTYVSDLQETLWTDRVAVMADPRGADTLQTIAAFASLHVGIMITICLIAQLIGLPRWIRTCSWVFLVLTILSTVYLGWHFAADVLGGLAMGSFSVWVAGLATGNRSGWRVRLRSLTEEEALASGGHPGALVSRSAPLPDHPAAD
ncbi:phosphatase PAP2 family protein [Nocardioides sp. MH1]|uniref:phosphatase PAP2 family protein n=1 Tax=Nocardioides sp. MH1 TaxID=3242490 RepID=UPI00352233B0